MQVDNWMFLRFVDYERKIVTTLIFTFQVFLTSLSCQSCCAKNPKNKADKEKFMLHPKKCLVLLSSGLSLHEARQSILEAIDDTKLLDTASSVFFSDCFSVIFSRGTGALYEEPSWHGAKDKFISTICRFILAERTSPVDITRRCDVYA